MNHTLLNYLPAFIRHRLDGRIALQNAITNTGWLFADKVLRMGVGLVVGVWVARYLGPEQFGLFSYASAFVALISSIATLGLDGIVVRDIVRHPEDEKEILGSAFMLKLIGGALALLLTVISIALLRPGDTLTRWIVGIIAAGFIFQAFDTIDLWFQSQVKSKYTVYAKNAAFLIVAIVKIILILQRAPLIAFVWAALLESVIGAIGLMIAYNFTGHFLKIWRVKYSHAKAMLEHSWPLIFSGLVIMVYMKIDQIMLGEIAGNEAVGVYSSAVSISEIWYFIPMIVCSSIYPSLIAAYQESEEKLYHRLKLIMGYFFWGTLLLSIIITFFSGDIIHLLYGDKYNGAGAVLAIHIFTGIIVSMSIIFSQKYVIDGTTKIGMIGSISGAIVNIILNFPLIHAYGGVGAAISTLISYTVPVFFLGIFVDRKILMTFIESITYVFSWKNFWARS